MRGKIKYRIALPTTGIIVLLLVISIGLSYALQKDQAEDSLRNEAYILSQEMSAVWDFIAVNQYRINHDADGSYNFKGLHCSIAGLSVGAIFSDRTDYVIRYASDVPRNPYNLSDGFEKEAIDAFRTDAGLPEYYGFADMKGQDGYFRYVIPLRMDSTCEDCHGLPKGEIDVTNFPKEGMARGDLVGVASISIPTKQYEEDIAQRTILQGLTLFLLSAGCLLTITLVTRRYVTRPLDKIEQTIERVGSGSFDERLVADEIGAKDELKSLVTYFNDAADKLQAAYQGLEDKVEERTEQLRVANAELRQQAELLEAMNERLTENDQYRTHYFTMVGHELKTPLSAILAYTSVLEDSCGQEDEEEKRVLGKIRSNALSLSRLIGDIVDISKFEVGKVTLDPQAVEIVDIFDALGRSLTPLADEKGVSLLFFSSRQLPLFSADPEKLLHALENLGSNAIKFSPPGSSVVFEAYYRKRDRSILIRVIDDGVGIAEEDREVVFEKFVQGRSHMAQPVKGSGLGLALAKEFVELHGGRIELNSELGRGSEFKVIMPFVEVKYEEERE